MRINRRQSQSCSSTSFEGWNNKGVIGGIFFQLARTEQSRASIIRIPSKKVLELLLDATNLIRIRCAQQIVADYVAADVYVRPRPCFVVARKQLSGSPTSALISNAGSGPTRPFSSNSSSVKTIRKIHGRN